MKKFHALFATLFTATSVFAADILEIRPCDAYGNTVKPLASISDPLGSGENLYFNIRLLTREENKGVAEAFRSKFSVDYTGTSPELDAVMNPLKIGIVVSGKTKWASLVKCQKTPSGNTDCLNLTDLIFEYHTEPGDFALPIKLAVDNNGTPAGEDDKGAGYIFRNNNLWKVRYYMQNGAGYDDAQFLFNPNYSKFDLSDYPDEAEKVGDPLTSNYSLKDCGFHVQTVNFEKPWETETTWRTVQEGVTVKGRLEVVAPVTNAVTLYVWSQDESVAFPVGSNVSTVKMNVPDATGKPVETDVLVAAVKIQGGQTYGEFNFKGKTKGKTANFVLSGFNHYTWNGTGTGARITDYVTVPVTCTEPPPPYIEFALDGKETTVTVPVDQKKSVAQFNLSLSAVWPGGDGKVSVTVAPMATDSTKVPDIYKYVHISDTLNETTAWNHDGTVTLTFDTQATVPVMTQPVYVYALGGCKDTSDESSPVKFRVVKIEPAAAATYFGTIKDSDFLYLKPAAADVIAPAADETISAVGGVARQLTFKLDDNYFNRNDRTTGYTIQWCKNYLEKPTETEQLGKRWVLQDGVLCQLKDDGTVDENVLPTVTYNVSGTYTSAFRIVGPNGEPTPGPTIREWQQVKVRVSDPATVAATAYDLSGKVSTTFDEGDDADIKISLSAPYDQDLWAFLKPSDGTLVSGDCVIGSVFSKGIYIMAGSVSSGDDIGTITFEDGTVRGVTLSFEVVLCTTEEYDETKVYKGYKSSKLSVKVYNVEPVLKDVNMNTVNKLVKRDGALWMNGSASINVEKTFTFKVTDPAVEADLNATGDDAFQLQWTIEENVEQGGISKGDTIKGNPNKASLKYTFSQPGKAKMTVALMDKDMKDRTGEFGEPFEFFINVTDYPSIYVDSDLGHTFEEDKVGAKNGKLTLHLSENPATITLDVEITVAGSGTANPGKLTLGGCKPEQDRPGVYKLTVPKGQRYVNLYIDEADGTADSATKGFYIVPRVTTTDPNPEGTPWSKYFSSEQGDPFLIENIAPTLYTSLVSLDTLRGSCGSQNNETNAYVVGIGETDPVTFSVTDVLADLGKAGSTLTNITVKWTSEGNTKTYYITDEKDYTFVPKFNSAGIKKVTVTVTDKDSKAGGMTTADWYYKVTASKQLTTYAHGPAGTSGTQDSNRYANTAKGLGEGRTWTDTTFSSASGWRITWNCGTRTEALCYAWGYKVGDVDNGALKPSGMDIKLDPNGNHDPNVAFVNYYTYPDKVKDSYFYRWLPVAVAETAGELTAFQSIAPEKTSGGAGSLALPLPNEKDEDENYALSKVEAIFSKEYLASDNMGDINQDGIPDAYVGAYLFNVVDDTGALTGNDLADQSAYNDDGDYFPASFTAGAAAFIPGGSNTWIMTGRPFLAKYEIRGFYEDGASALNNAPALAGVKDVTPEVCYEDPAKNTKSTLSPLEWDAYVQADKPGYGTAHPEEQWSPERPTDPTKVDTDEDGLPDGYEYYIWYKATVGWFDNDGSHKYLTGRKYNPYNPFAPVEISSKDLAAKFDPLTDNSINWDKEDTDNDGIPDTVEFLLGTNPWDFDTDGDGLPDGYELYITQTDPLKYATDDKHCDATLNEYGPNAGQGDVMAEYETSLNTIGLIADDGSTEWFGCDADSKFDTAKTAAPDTVTLIRILTTNAADNVTTNLYITTKKVKEKDGVLIGDYDKSETWTARYDEDGSLLRGAPTKLAKGTKVTEVVKDQAYFNEEVTFPEVYYVLWVYGYDNAGNPILARGRKSDKAQTLKAVCAAAAKRTVKVQHYYVRRTKPFDPRTGWKDTPGSPDPVNSRTFTHMDEFLTMTFFLRAGGLTPADITPTEQRTIVQIWQDFSTSPTNCDTDGDNMPDGWELYLMGGTADSVGDGPGPRHVYSPLYSFSQITDPLLRDNDIDLEQNKDMLEWPEEYSGTLCSAYYANMGCESIYQLNTDWRNKSMPTDPWNYDTDGDGVLDGYEGGQFPPGLACYGVAVRDYFMFNSSGMAGGGLNPLSWDTDLDGLPDPWEIEYHGTWTAGGSTSSSGSTNATAAVTGCTWNMDGMNGTVADARLDYDNDGLANWQEYLVGAMRCWRYDDPESTWGMLYASKDELEAILKNPGTAEWNTYWYERLLDTANKSGNYNPHFANGFFDAGTAYFSCCTNAFDSAKGKYYMLKDGIYHDQVKTVRWGQGAGAAGMPYKQLYPAKYISCDPREADTDCDGMDDYYELFHGLNPLLGAPAVGHSASSDEPYDVIYDAYLRSFLGARTEMSDGISALNNWWRNDVEAHETVPGSGIKHPDLDGYDFIAHPWLNGIAGADPDGDNVGNQEEAIMPKAQAASTYHHTDPTPLWMTDTSYTNSLTRRYYRLTSPQGEVDLSGWFAEMEKDPTFEWEGVTYYLKDFPGFKYANAKLSFAYTLDQWSVARGWAFSFEENEGYDSDHDFLSDFEEAQGKTKNASDPQDHDDPIRRQAMYFGGEANPSFLQTPLAAIEYEPDSPDASSEARQNFLYFTVECWAKPDADTVAKRGLQTLVERAIWADNAGPADEKRLRKNFLIGLFDGHWYAAFDSTGTDAKQTIEVTDGLNAATTNWTHVAATYDGKALRLYVNGKCDNVHTTSIQPEHGVNALAISKAGEINPKGGLIETETIDDESKFISILVGASAGSKNGIVYDLAWRFRDGAYNTDKERANPEGLPVDKTTGKLLVETTYTNYCNYYKGYIDEVRIWDGARSAEDIKSDCDNRVRYTTALAEANRLAVYDQWKMGGTRSPSSATGVELPPQLMYHWAFDHIAGAVLAEDVIEVPVGFATAKSVTDAKAKWVRPADYVSRSWNSCAVRSTVYADNAWVPWINNTVSHLRRFDLTTLDSVYWSEDYAGSRTAGSYGYGAFEFPRTHEVLSRWTQFVYGDPGFYDLHLDADFAFWNAGNTSPAMSQAFSQRSRLDVISGYGSTAAGTKEAASNLTEVVMALRFALRDRNTVGDDILPMGGAYPRRISAAEGGMWDTRSGEPASASDAWAQTGSDSDNNGLPDWWDEYARANYCPELSPQDPLNWDTVITYKDGTTMTALAAYLRDLTEGLVKIGDTVAVLPEYADTRDMDRDGIPDWWEERYALDCTADNTDEDEDNDQLSNVIEYLISSLSDFPDLNPTKVSSGSGQVVPDYFLRHGSLYLGEMFSDHDMVEDWWEDEQETELRRGGERYPNISRYVYDAHGDADDDGWSNWEERQAEFVYGTHEELAYTTTNTYVKMVTGTAAELEAMKVEYEAKYANVELGSLSSSNANAPSTTTLQYTEYVDVSNTVPNYTGRPVPEVPVLFVYNGQRGALKGQTIVVKAWQQNNAYDPDLSREADAEWTVTANETWPLNQQETLKVSTNGYLRSGKNMFVAYVAQASSGTDTQADDSTSTVPAFVPGMPYGVVKDVKVDYLKSAPITIELSDISPAMLRFNIAQALSVQGGYVAGLAGIDLEKALVPSKDDDENVDRAAYFANVSNCYLAVRALTDRGAFDRTYAGTWCPDTFGTNTTLYSSNVTVRVIRSDVNGQPHKVCKDSQGVPYYSYYASSTPAFEGSYDVWTHPVITEADMLAKGILDLDWGTVAQAYVQNRDNSFADVVSATYRIVLFDGTSNNMTNNAILATCLVNRFERGDEPTPATNLTVKTYGGQPTFSWTHANTIGKPYPAFRLRAYEGGTMVYDSGNLPAPMRDSKGYYNYTAEIWPGMMTLAGVPFKADVTYTWEVSMLDAKFSDIDCFYDVASSTFRIPGSGTLSDYGKIAVAVKYMGPGVVSTNSLKNLMRVEAYDTPDFSGLPLGATYVKAVKDSAGRDTLAATDSLGLNAVIEGLPKGKSYYVRAFLDTTGDGKRDVWESWGYANYVGTSRKDVYTPYAVEVPAGMLTPECVVYVEDADTNNNKLPDVWEWNKYGQLGGASTAGVGAKSPYVVTLSDKGVKTAQSLVNKYGQLGVTQLPYYASLAEMWNGGTLSPVALGLAVAGLDVAELKTTPQVKITAFSTAEGVAFDVNAATTLGGQPFENSAFKVEVKVTLQLEHTDSLAAEWQPVGEPVTETFTVSETETVVSEKINQAIRELAEQNGGTGFFRVNATIESK